MVAQFSIQLKEMKSDLAKWKKKSAYRHLEAVSWAVSIIEALNEICFSFSFTGWNISISHGTIFC